MSCNGTCATSYSHICPQPCRAVLRRQCCSRHRSTTSKWRTSYVARSTALCRTWSSALGKCVDTSGIAVDRSSRNSSWLRTFSVRWSSASRNPRSRPSAGTGSTEARRTSRCTSSPRTLRSAWPGTAGPPGCAPPSTGSNNITDQLD